MSRYNKAMVRERIIRLAKLRSTGTPAQLAIRLEISERSVKRLIRDLKREGIIFRYDYDRMSYLCHED
ncbi:MAG TPA: HTH domain-containing protein [Bacteroidales bacterium]|nr:HTH domain-containing protein [Bacteroidales bacterium]